MPLASWHQGLLFSKLWEVVVLWSLLGVELEHRVFDLVWVLILIDLLHLTSSLLMKSAVFSVPWLVNFLDGLGKGLSLLLLNLGLQLSFFSDSLVKFLLEFVSLGLELTSLLLGKFNLTLHLLDLGWVFLVCLGVLQLLSQVLVLVLQSLGLSELR